MTVEKLPSGELRKRLRILFISFFRISAVSVGGGLTMLPLMSAEFVDKRRWMSDAEMVDVVSVVQSVPGIIAFNMSVMIGCRVAGIPGAVAAMLGVALPPFFAIILLASCFLQLQGMKLVADIFTGVRACIAALILLSVVKMGKSVFKGIPSKTICILAFLSLLIFQVNAIGLIVAAAFAGLALGGWEKFRTPKPTAAPKALLAGAVAAAGAAPAAFGFSKLFLLFAKIGLFTFGGGYAMVPLFQDELVRNYHFLDGSEFANLVSLAQVTPGPVGLNAATYIGYQCGAAHGGGIYASLWGATVGTLGVMVPSFAVVLWVALFLKAYRNNRTIQSILNGIRPATLGLIAYAVVFFLETSAFMTPVTNLWKADAHFQVCWQGCVIFLLSLLVSMRWKIGMIPLLLGSAALSALLFQITF